MSDEPKNDAELSEAELDKAAGGKSEYVYTQQKRVDGTFRGKRSG
jgi:hypothetical protein